LARTKGKPVYLSETSAKDVNISNDSQDGINDWNNWFAKFFGFIDVHKEIKGFAYINANWPTNANTWGDARIQNSQYVSEKYRAEMRKPKYIHLRATPTTGVETIENGFVPHTMFLSQNYPNPFNPSTTIRYDLPKAANVSLKISNTLGQLVATLVDERKEAGYHTVQWIAGVPSGIYFYRLSVAPSARRDLVPTEGRNGQAEDVSTGSARGFVETKKMLLLR